MFTSFKLFKTHCDYMERTKILFGNDNRLENNMSSGGANANSGASRTKSASQQQQQQQHGKTSSGQESSATAAVSATNVKQLIDLLRSSAATINRNDLINALKASTRAEINQAISALLSQSQEAQQTNAPTNPGDSGAETTAAQTAAAATATESSGATKPAGAKKSQPPAPASRSASESNEDSSSSMGDKKSLNEASSNTGTLTLSL